MVGQRQYYSAAATLRLFSSAAKRFSFYRLADGVNKTNVAAAE
jgi:hypothetical protein